MTDISDVKHHIEILTYCANRRRELAELERISRAAVEEALGEHDTGEVDGVTVVTWKHVKARRLDLQEFKTKLPEVFELYCTVNESRRFVLQ